MKKKGNFRLKSKHLILLMTIVCVSMVTAAFSTGITGDSARETAGYIIIPFEKGINKIGNWLLSVQDNFQSVKKLARENKKLKAQIDELTLQNNELVQNQTDITHLRELYDLDKEYAQYNKILAEVIAKEPGNWYHSFTINKGTNDGVSVDSNVLAGAGLVGIVTETGADWAAVRSIVDDDSNVSAQVSETEDTCMVTGDLELIDSGKIEFSQLQSPEGKVSIGDRVVTSHISDKYVKGLLIGYISEISQDSNNLTYGGYLLPAADFRHLQKVLVITDMKEKAEKEKKHAQ